ncbi:phosphate starvation inducible protein, PhoH-like protein [Thermoclostridium stercorarium subsp. stercorarium DSM 8532]|uniref:PhoH-like protein n=3 Tax=Thermoclostridium stercorarium TaxID=1510 RepID=L7VM43_THES1|nr:PhoH family protein [Thermoclostridium stercorarium]AGC67571.1 phosphate starvation inducible protein, PhoH-like protein [Thermoclostridium stercorarium subsp. stercorarium DSM 8532]AGI38620.1 PhoH [Thermoclostridium stercorarium subsp. stercorarium DSM 8532]ANW97993.1 phosphate starvation-inducible protein PhoH [Thermoclostridium stercorarium subsp. thermolacticum DSM 2910]ANX00543.1 phosphate starvation-inducible protein PhoH [Thermoclostridium stercorarium subsp. leptospartum DSM 9219]UZ
MEAVIEKNIEIPDIETEMNLFGQFDQNIRIIEDTLDVKITNRENEVKISGFESRVDQALEVIQKLLELIKHGETITAQNVKYLLSINGENIDETDGLPLDLVCITARGKPIKSKTYGQKRYIEAIKRNTIVFGIGPAGTGKTFLAVAMAVKAFREKAVSRIILTRPAVEAGERLGFLPGDLQNKVDPYLRPLYDALYQIMGPEAYMTNMEKGIIEVAPLAYMRGRTLDDSFIILDEAQNTTPEQMKMFLTRIGMGSKAVVTGDITQIDLPRGKKSGLVEVQKILQGVEGIEFVYLTGRDVVRHELVQRIIDAYEQYENRVREEQEKEKE